MKQKQTPAGTTKSRKRTQQVEAGAYDGRYRTRVVVCCATRIGAGRRETFNFAFANEVENVGKSCGCEVVRRARWCADCWCCRLLNLYGLLYNWLAATTACTNDLVLLFVSHVRSCQRRCLQKSPLSQQWSRRRRPVRVRLVYWCFEYR